MHSRLSLILPFLALLLNLYWLYPETRALFDVNDNVFAYSLALRASEVAATYCHPSPVIWFDCITNLTDHWVDYWGQGYPLPHFYQHLPSILFVLIHRLVNLIAPISLYTVFRYTQFAALSLFPLTLYWCARQFGLSRLTSGYTSLLSTLLSTQFLYGTDLNAVTWRGSGMTTQLLGMVTLPLAIGSVYHTLTRHRSHARSALLLTLTFHMHLLFGFLALLSTGLLWTTDIVAQLFTTPHPISPSLLRNHSLPVIKNKLTNLLKFLIPVTLLLSYWLLPLLSHNQYHNTSVWDEQIKFDSYGAKTVIAKLLSGDLLDANRPPVLTFLLAIGILISLSTFFRDHQSTQSETPRPKSSISEKITQPATGQLTSQPNLIYLYLPLLFLFFLTLYFGPATWGQLFFLIPGTEGLHVHRLINGVHFASFFLIAIALTYTSTAIQSFVARFTTKFHTPSTNRPWLSAINNLSLLLPLLLLAPAIRERHQFMSHNTFLITEHLKIYDTEKSDLAKVIDTIRSRPSRTNAGRPGNWGKKFTTGGGENFLHLSEAGIPTIGWLPQSWSPFSDIEQFLSETRLDHYQLMNVGWIYQPSEIPLPKFATPVLATSRYTLASVPTTGNFQFLTVPFTVFGHKNHVLNFQRLWLESQWPGAWSIPQIVLTEKPIKITSTEPLHRLKRPTGSPVDGPDILLTDMGTFSLRGESYNLITSKLFDATPSALPQDAQVVSESKLSPHHYRATVETPQTLALMLKTTYHPYWQVTVDGQPNPKFMVAPAFLATPIPPGEHTVDIRYTVPLTKKLLLALSLATLLPLLYRAAYDKNRHKSRTNNSG